MQRKSQVLVCTFTLVVAYTYNLISVHCTSQPNLLSLQDHESPNIWSQTAHLSREFKNLNTIYPMIYQSW